MPTVTCPLCSSTSLLSFHRDKKRDYLRCRDCLLVFVPPSQHLSQSEEKTIYDLHENSLADPGYRNFLSRIAKPLQARLPAKSAGLDYGCGPGPMLAQMLKEQGHSVEIYDPIYADEPEVLQSRYDFVTCTEVVEHFRKPDKEFSRLFDLLKPGGLLAIMTKLVIDAEAFGRWHYKNDLTHIGFYSEETLYWLAGKYRCQIEILGKDVAIFRKRF